MRRPQRPRAGVELREDPCGVIVEDADEQVVVRRAREIRAEGASLREVGRRLLDDGQRPRTGKRWHVQVVARMVAG